LLIQKIKWFQFKTAVKDWSFSRAASLNALRKIGLQLNCLDQLWFATKSLQCKPKSRQVLTLVLNAVYRHTALSLYFCILVTFRPKFALTPNSETGIKEAAMLRYDKKCYFNVRSKADISQLNLPHGTHTHTHTRLTALFPGLTGYAGTRKVKPIWILPKQEIVSGSGISWAICKSTTRSRQITTPAPHHSVFYRPDALPAAKPTGSKH